MTHQFSHFSPGAAERITGVSADLQRTWRKRGFLPAREEGKTIFSTLDVAALMIRMQLVRWGVSLSAKIDGESDHLSILWFALMDIDQTCEVMGTPPEIAEFERKWSEDEDGVALYLGFSEHGVDRYLSVDPEGGVRRFSDSASLIDEDGPTSLLIIDLSALGHRLGRSAGSSLIKVKLSEGDVAFSLDKRQMTVRLPHMRNDRSRR